MYLVRLDGIPCTASRARKLDSRESESLSTAFILNLRQELSALPTQEVIINFKKWAIQIRGVPGAGFGGKVNYLGNHRFFQNMWVLRSQVHVSLELASLYKPPQTASFQQHRFNRVTGNAWLWWSRGVVCLSELRRVKRRFNHEHPGSPCPHFLPARSIASKKAVFLLLSVTLSLSAVFIRSIN